MLIDAGTHKELNELKAQVAGLAIERNEWKQQALSANVVMLALKEAESEVARLRQALDDFGEHRHSCMADWFSVSDTRCTCGLNAARQRPERKEGE